MGPAEAGGDGDAGIQAAVMNEGVFDQSSNRLNYFEIPIGASTQLEGTGAGLMHAHGRALQDTIGEKFDGQLKPADYFSFVSGLRDPLGVEVRARGGRKPAPHVPGYSAPRRRHLQAPRKADPPTEHRRDGTSLHAAPASEQPRSVGNSVRYHWRGLIGY